MAYLDKIYYTRRFVADYDMSHCCLNFPSGYYYVTNVYVIQGIRSQQLFFTVNGVQQPDYSLNGYFTSTDLTAFTIERNDEFYFSFYVRGDFPISEFEGLHDSEDVIIIGNGDMTGGTTVIIDGNEAIILNPSNPADGPITAVVGNTEEVPYSPGITDFPPRIIPGDSISAYSEFTLTTDFPENFLYHTISTNNNSSLYISHTSSTGNNPLPTTGSIVSPPSGVGGKLPMQTTYVAQTTGIYSYDQVSIISYNSVDGTPYSPNVIISDDFTIDVKLDNLVLNRNGDIVFKMLCRSLDNTVRVGAHLYVSGITWWPDYFVSGGIIVYGGVSGYSGTSSGATVFSTSITSIIFRMARSGDSLTTYFDIGDGFVQYGTLSGDDVSLLSFWDILLSLRSTYNTYTYDNSVDVDYIRITPSAVTDSSGVVASFFGVGSATLLPSFEVAGTGTRWLGLNQGHLCLPSLLVGSFQTDNDRADVALPAFSCTGNIRWVYCSMEFPALEAGGGHEVNWGEMTFPTLTCDSTLTYAYFFSGIMPTLSALSFGQGVPSTIANSLKPEILLEEHPDITEIANTLFLGM